MRETLIFLAVRVSLCVILVTLAQAQAAAGSRWAGGYTVLGVSGSLPFTDWSEGPYHLAGGAEYLVAEHLGVRGEFAVMNGPSLVLSANVVVRLRSWREARLQPFMTGGYSSIGTNTETIQGWNAGVGADYLLKDEFALRTDVILIGGPTNGSSVRGWALRVGMAFR